MQINSTELPGFFCNSFRYTGCWLVRHRPLYATIATSWLACITMAMMPLALGPLGVDTSLTSVFNAWHDYTTIYVFYGLPLILILMMNLVIVKTICTLEPDRSDQKQVCIN